MRSVAEDRAPTGAHAVSPPALGVSSWSTPVGVKLDLRYASDEMALLDIDIARLWKSVIDNAEASGAALAGHYAVDDAYGGARAAPTVSRFFDLPLCAEQVTFGAGVTALLHALSSIAAGGTVIAPELTHPDLEAWARARGSHIVTLTEPYDHDELMMTTAGASPALVHVDRPDFLGRLTELREVEELALAARTVGAIVLIDESAAQYLGPSASAVQLVNRVDNLVVLRGFTKAYSLGGMRAAFAVASPELAPIVRSLVPPLQVSELSLVMALEVLRAGDMFSSLRARVRQVRPAVVAVLERAGIRVIAPRHDVPWLGLRDRAHAAARYLESRGVFALRPTPTGSAPSPAAEVLRLTIPLSDQRITCLAELLA